MSEWVGILSVMPNPHPRVDWTGRQFNRWTVISRGTKAGTEQRWLCRCVCGKESLVHATNLKTGASKSCGCWNREVARRTMKALGLGGRGILPGDLGSRNALLCRNKAAAEKRGLAFTITDEQAFRFYKCDCFYCGAAPAQKAVGWKSVRTLPYIYNGLDRLDSSLGYVPGNVVSCCGRCNRAKMETSYEDFVAWIDRVNRHLYTRVKTLALVR